MKNFKKARPLLDLFALYEIAAKNGQNHAQPEDIWSCIFNSAKLNGNNAASKEVRKFLVRLHLDFESETPPPSFLRNLQILTQDRCLQKENSGIKLTYCGWSNTRLEELPPCPLWQLISSCAVKREH